MLIVVIRRQCRQRREIRHLRKQIEQTKDDLRLAQEERYSLEGQVESMQIHLMKQQKEMEAVKRQMERLRCLAEENRQRMDWGAHVKEEPQEEIYGDSFGGYSS